MGGTANTVWESLALEGEPVANGVIYIDPDTLQPNVDPDGLAYDPTTQETGVKKLAVEQGIAGASGNVAINKMAGQVQFAVAAQSLILTNDRIEADSIVICTVATDDATAFAAKAIVDPAGGSATIKLNAAATGITKVNFLILGAK